MLYFPGGQARSAFRIHKLTQSLQASFPEIRDLAADWFYLVDAERDLLPEEESQLNRLLDDGSDPSRELAGTVTDVWVIPRLGTLSPWSSKATDILHHCGLAGIRRIERGLCFRVVADRPFEEADWRRLAKHLHDPMTESVVAEVGQAVALFHSENPRPLERIALGSSGIEGLREANQRLGLALSEDEMEYLATSFGDLDRDPTDVELMMFAQANSEHCRHKIFNASWTIDGEDCEASLFDMIRATYRSNSEGVLSAYRDNAAVVSGYETGRLMPDEEGCWQIAREPAHLVMKVETHNHPTAISPFPGAATGAGGEIRDEAATGIAARSKAGLTGFSVSNLRLEELSEPWEGPAAAPAHIASPVEIMRDGPIGAAAFNNEFGRPNLAGYFRSFEQQPEVSEGPVRGYHKPIMIAGGMGNIRPGHVEKRDVPPGARIIVLGGPGMLIGLGGGAASSVASGASDQELDFASVQRDNPEIQRRCQEVIDRCRALGEDNPIRSIHDVGAGGLSNAIPEILDDAGRGGRINLRRIPSAEPGMSPMEIWCNEAQERYVLAVAPEDLEAFSALAEAERCPFADVGEATADGHLTVVDPELREQPVDMPMSVLLGKTPKMSRETRRCSAKPRPLDPRRLDVEEAVRRVLRHPAVADKEFLITIGDRSVGGLTVRDQMVGPWQVPVADCAVTLSGQEGFTGEAMAMGERAPLAIIDGPASGRMAVTEALTNIAAADIGDIRQVRLSANWMAAANHEHEDAVLYDTVRAVGQEFCSHLGMTIPVGKDSLSMKTRWAGEHGDTEVVSPVSLVVSAFAPVRDVRRSVTPEISPNPEDPLYLVDLGCGRDRLAGSILAQVHEGFDSEAPDLEDPDRLAAFFGAIQELVRERRLLAYHDRSDGGLLATLAEMAFAARSGLEIDLGVAAEAAMARLFSEEAGAVIQVASGETEHLEELMARYGLQDCLLRLGRPQSRQEIRILAGGEAFVAGDLWDWLDQWNQVSYRMQRLRDNPDCAEEARRTRLDPEHPGLVPRLTFDPAEDVAAPMIAVGAPPRMAILREQGVNGQVEMAEAFRRAGFESVDVHMAALQSGQQDLGKMDGLAVCGGFSYGDVLGAGQGWAKSVLFNDDLREAFARFFARSETFALGVCNGCQMLSALRDLIPGAEHWPRFLRNRSEQFEARLSLVEIPENPSLFLDGMMGSRLPIAVAHGEGRARFASRADEQAVVSERLVAMRYVDGHGRMAMDYPDNPNGSPDGITGLTTPDGRVTVMMPHPERITRMANHSWKPPEWEGDDGPWLRMFRNARRWLD